MASLAQVARAPPTPTPAPVAPAMSAPLRRRSLASQLRLAAQQRAREELELRRAQRHCRAAGTQTEEVGIIGIAGGRVLCFDGENPAGSGLWFPP